MFKNKNSLFTGWPHSQGEKTEHISRGRTAGEHGWNEEQGCYSCPPFLISHLLSFRLFLSPPHSQPNLNPFPHACLLFPLCKPHTQSQHYTFPAVVGRGKQWGWPTRAARSPFPGVMLVVALPSQLAQLAGCG